MPLIKLRSLANGNFEKAPKIPLTKKNIQLLAKERMFTRKVVFFNDFNEFLTTWKKP